MESLFHALGLWIHRARRGVLVAWVAAIALAAPAAGKLPAALLGGSGAIPGSQSERVERELHDDFPNPFAHALLVTFHSDRLALDTPAYHQAVEATVVALKALPGVRRVASPLDTPDARLRSADGHAAAVLVGIDARGIADEERAVPVLRAAVAKARDQFAAADPGAVLAVTGHAALTYDLNDYNKHDGDAAENRALPLTLLVLLVAFGSLAAAAMPLAVGVASVMVASAIAYALALHWPLSNLLQNIMTMIGLAVGIDYALLVVSRYRECRAETAEPAEALARTVASAGSAVFFSGLTVMIGLAGLVFTPLMETRSIGWGGAIVVVVAVLAANTLLPALLAILGPRVDWPAWLARPLRNARAEAGWKRLAEGVMRRPWPVLVLATAIALVLAYPGFSARTGFIAGNWFPRGMEARTGLEVLGTLGRPNAIIPVNVIVRTPDGSPVLTAAHLPALLKLSRRLHADARVGDVLSPVDLRPDLKPLQYVLLYHDPARALQRYPAIAELMLNRDHSAALFQVVPAATVAIDDAQQLARDVAATPVDGLALEVGGEPQYYNDFNDRMRASFPLVVGLVVGATLVVLFGAFRSYLLPVKAVLTNLLAVGAGWGVLTLVFERGWGAGLVGLDAPLSAVPLAIPLMIFCITFGLSMDYEIFLLSRIQAAYRPTGDNRAATAEGLAATGGIITSAAAIMVVVFGAFVLARIAILKMLGLGLAVAVLVDATLIRVLLVPAVMAIAGRWNWVPGDRHA